MITFKKCNWSRRWLHDRLFTILALLQEYYKLIAIDLSKQKKIDTSPKAIQKLNFPRNLEKDGDTELFFIIQEVIESILDFWKVAVKVLRFYFVLTWY